MTCEHCGEPLTGLHIVDGCPTESRRTGRMNRDEIIEQAARFACTARPGHDHQPRLDQECAWVLAVCENLADAGLLARPLPSREEIADVIHPGNLFGHLTPTAMADAVLDLLKGQGA